MLYLVLAILCSTVIALLLKFSEIRNLNRYAVTSSNYLAAFLLGLILTVEGSESLLIFETGFEDSAKSFSSEFSNVILHNCGTFSVSATLIWLIILGFTSGVFYFLGFISIQKSIKANGVGLTSAYSKLGIFVPMLFAIMFWNEIPGLLKIFGIILAVIAILLSNISLKEINIFKGFRLLLILTLITVGLAEFSNKIFEKYTNIEYRGLFLALIFLTAGFISIFFTIFSKQYKQKISYREIFVGFCVGIPNFFSSYFIIKALKEVMTTIAFPIYSSGSILLIALGGFVIFKEKFSGQEKIAILMIIVAIIFMTI